MTYASRLEMPWATERREKRRRFVVRAVLFIYILSLIEGPLRKWIFPELAGPLTLLRDPFVIALYGYALVKGFMDRCELAALWLGFAAITSFIGLLQYMINGFGPIGWILGVRTYWLYMPIAFVVAKAFRVEDVLFFIRLNLWIALPYAALVSAQYNAGASAFINRGVGGDESTGVSLGDGILRPFGLFTYTGPNTQFTAAMIAVFATLYLARQYSWLGRPQFIVMAVAIATMAVLTGSRGIYLEAGIILGFTVLGLLLAQPNSVSLMKILGIVALVGLAATLFVYVFPDMLDAMDRRLEHAERSEGSIWNRIYYSGFSFIDAFYTAPLIGHGIGSGASGVSRYIGVEQFIYGEADTQRNINELGLIFGPLLLVLRWGTAIYIAIRALKLSRCGYIIPLPLAGFVLMPLSFGTITNSPINAFIVWLFVGLVLVKVSDKKL